MAKKIIKTEDEWRAELTEEQYLILREKGTERAFTGKYYNNKETGKYYCAACGELLFTSKEKYDSGSGWPSFYNPAAEGALEEKDDATHGMRRTEIKCASCGSHMGHVFEDGPPPTGLRYCINSASLDFKKES